MTTRALVVLIICWPIPLLHFWQLISHRHGCRWTPFFGWPLTIKYCFFLAVYSQFFRGCFFHSWSFRLLFSQLVFLLGPKRPLLPSQLWERPQKNHPSHDNALCTLCLRFHGKSLSGLLLLRIRQHILYLYFVWHMIQNCIEMCGNYLDANFG